MENSINITELTQEEIQLIAKKREAEKTEEQRQRDNTLEQLEKRKQSFLDRIAGDARKIDNVNALFVEAGIKEDRIEVKRTDKVQNFVYDHHQKYCTDEELEPYREVAYPEFTLKVDGFRIEPTSTEKAECWSLTERFQSYKIATLARKLNERIEAQNYKESWDAKCEARCEEAIGDIRDDYQQQIEHIFWEKVDGGYTYYGRKPVKRSDYYAITVEFKSGSSIEYKCAMYGDRYELQVNKVHDVRYKTQRDPAEWMDLFAKQS